MKKILSFLLVLVLGLTIVGCGEKEVAVTSVSVSSEKTEYVVGDSFTLTAKVSPTDATNKKVAWSSSDDSVATIDQSGKATALKAGSVKFTAKAESDESKKGEVTITIKEKAVEIKVSSVAVEITSESLVVGEEATIVVKVAPDDATNKDYTLNVSDQSVVSVTGNKVKALKAGQATITATAKDGSGVSGQVVITVTEDTAKSIEITGAKEAMAVGEEVSLTVNVKPVGSEYELVSSNPEVVKVEGTKLVALAAGEATITATLKADSQVKAEVKVTVTELEDPTYFIIITGNKYKAPMGEDLALSYLFYPEAPEDDRVIWSVDNESIATINEDGVLTPVSLGKVKVTVTSVADSRVAYYVNIEIVAADDPNADQGPTSMTLRNKADILLLHSKLTDYLERTIIPIDTQYNKSVYYESSDNSVVTIKTANGSPVIVGVGTCTLYVYSQLNPEIYAEVEITVTEYTDPETFIITNGVNSTEVTSVKIEPGKTSTLVPTVTPANGNPAATFVSSDENVATVDENGKVKAVAEGTCTITVTSQIKPEFVKVVNVTVEEQKVSYDVEEVKINGEKEMYVGYKLKLAAAVYPETAPQTVTWELYKTELATLAEDGTITAIATGTIRVRAVSTVDPTKKSAYFNIKIQAVPTPPAVGDMKGYEIIIMNASSALTDNDPFLEGYSQPDKAYKQRAWSEVENKYNCDIKVVAYPDIAPWGTARINWIIDNATAGTSQCDLGIVSSNWIYQFAQANAAVDVSELYAKYGLSQMDNATKSAGSYNGKLYIASQGLSPTATYVDLGLYYNYGWLKKLGVEDPAAMFNQDRWHYSEFKDWVLTTQAKLGENQFVLQGSPYYYWFGMTNAAGQKVVDSDTVKIFIDTPKSKNASALIYELVQNGAVNATQTWAENDDIEHSFHDGETLMTTGYMWFCGTENRWPNNLWGEGTTEYAYVPFPYPDDMSNVDTKISLSGLSVYMYIAGRPYPSSLGSDGYVKVWTVMNEMFLNTITYQEADPLFNAEDTVRNSLNKRIDNEESVKAIMFYNANRIFYDPAHAVYGSTSATPLKTPANNVMYKGESYDEEFNAVEETFYNDIIKVYAASN